MAIANIDLSLHWMEEKNTRRDKRIDKIMRKNLEHPSVELLSFFFTGEVEETTPLPPKISQVVFEQEPDTLLLIKMKNRKNFIFHLEFQSTNDPRMADRMASYDYMLRLKHNLDVMSVVMYTGNELLNMKNSILYFNNYYEYQLIDIRDIDPELFLHSKKPSEIMLAILTGRDGGDRTLQIRRILEKLQEKLSSSPSMLNEQVGIFKILGAIRGDNIQQQIIREEQHMPIMYDLNKVFFYQQALREGIEKGVEQGIVQGVEQGSHTTISKVVNNMLQAGVTIETIQTYTGLTIKELQNILQEINRGSSS